MALLPTEIPAGVVTSNMYLILLLKPVGWPEQVFLMVKAEVQESK